MSRILFIYERDMPTMAATKDIFSNLDPSYGIKSDFMFLSDVKASDIDKHEVIVFMRPNDTLSATIAKMAKNTGRFVMTFCDDDLLNYMPLAPWRRKGLLKTLEESDLIWTPSMYIGEEYKQYTNGKRYIKIDTIVRPEQIETRKKRKQFGKDTIKIVYAAGAAHLSLFNEYAKASIGQIAQKYGNKISLTFIGVRPELPDIEKLTTVRYEKGMPLAEYRKYMAKEQFDIGIAPLADTRFTRCKYFNKYIEYSLSGVCGIYSNVIPYRDAVKNEITGLLTDNDQESWEKALTAAVTNDELREKCIDLAQRDLRDNYNEKRIIEDFINQVPEIISCECTQEKCKGYDADRVGYALLRLVDSAYLGMYYLLNGGVKGFYDKWKTHFRERGAYSRKGDKKI